MLCTRVGLDVKDQVNLRVISCPFHIRAIRNWKERGCLWPRHRLKMWYACVNHCKSQIWHPIVLRIYHKDSNFWSLHGIPFTGTMWKWHTQVGRVVANVGMELSLWRIPLFFSMERTGAPLPTASSGVPGVRLRSDTVNFILSPMENK